MLRMAIPAKDVVVCDLDGTISLDTHRAHYLKGSGNPNNQWDKYFAACGSDEPNWPVIQLLTLFRVNKKKIYILSGRVEKVRIDTLEWLDRYKVPWDALEMRPTENRVDDTTLKLQWVDTLAIRERIWLVLEDRSRMVRAWRDAGFPCFQVAEGDF
jgi:hypothetical protein